MNYIMVDLSLIGEQGFRSLDNPMITRIAAYVQRRDFENNQEEWKEKWDSSYLKAIAAFYNTDGGRMVVGRRNDGPFVGLVDPKDTAKKISDTVHNKLHINVSVHIKNIKNVDCVVVDVYAGNRMVDLDGQFFVRVGNTNQALEGEELRTALLNEKGMTGWIRRASTA